MKNKLPDILMLICRLGLGLIFIYAGAVKILNPSAFAADIDNYRLAPYLLVTLAAAILPWLEVTVGILMLIGKWLQSSSLILIALNVVFLIAIASAMARGLDIDCGCFSVGGDATRVGIVRLLEDVVFLAAAAFVFIRSRQRVSPVT